MYIGNCVKIVCSFVVCMMNKRNTMYLLILQLIDDRSVFYSFVARYFFEDKTSAVHRLRY